MRYVVELESGIVDLSQVRVLEYAGSTALVECDAAEAEALKAQDNVKSVEEDIRYQKYNVAG